MSPKTTSSSLSLSPSSPLSYSTTSSSSSSLPSSSLLSRAATTSSVGSSASDGKAPFPRGRQRGGPSSSPPRARPPVRASSRRNLLLPAATACGGRRSPSHVPRVGTSPGVTGGRRVRACVKVGRQGGKETAPAPLYMPLAAASLLTGAVATALPPAAQVCGRCGSSSPAVAGPSVARKSASRLLCDGKRLRRGRSACRRTSTRKDRIVDDRGCAARFVDRSSRFFDSLEALSDRLASSFTGPVLLRLFPSPPGRLFLLLPSSTCP